MTGSRGTRDVTVIVPTIGRRPHLGACLSSILACDPGPAEVLLVEQRGRGVAADLARASTDARVIALTDHGTGPGRARNLGARRAKYGLLAFTDDDCEVEPRWIGAASRLHEAFPMAMLTGQVLPLGDPARVPSTIAGSRPRDYSGTVTASALYSGNMVVSRDGLLEFGAFDERFALAEDNDLCYRWLRAGRSLRFEPDLVVGHRDWRSRGELEALRVDYAWAQGSFYAKHLRAGDLRVLKLWLQGALVSSHTRVCRREPSPETPAVGRELRSLIANWHRFNFDEGSDG